MISNYLKTAYRNLLKTKIFSIINISGLAIGMAAFLLIMHYVSFERSFDKFNSDYKQIYRLRYERYSEDGSSVKFASCCPPAGALLRERFPDAGLIGRTFKFQAIVSYADLKFSEERIFYAEPDLFKILKFNFLSGDPVTDLVQPNKAFMSQSMAQKYFGKNNPIGKTISIDQKTDFQIAGLFEDMPENSHIKMDFILSFENLVSKYGPDYTENWGHTGMYTYLKMNKDFDLKDFESKIARLIDTEFGEALKKYKMEMKLPLQPIADIHLTSHFMQEYEANGNSDTVDLLFIIALFVVVMAWINYISLSTARSLNRAKEVGLRKVVGANRFQLAVQFFSETILINLFALIVALSIIHFTLPLFNSLTGVTSKHVIWLQEWFVPVLLLLVFAGIFLSGIYPVLALTAYKPVTILRGKFSNSSNGRKLRKALVAIQFLLAFILITGTFSVFKQINFMIDQEVGFEMEQVLVIKAPRVRDEGYAEKLKSFRETLLPQTSVLNICHVTEVPGRQLYWDAGGIMKAGEDITKSKNYQIVGVDYDFTDLFELEIVAGRNFSREFSTDAEGLMFNETAVKWMGFESNEEAVGQKVSYWGNLYTIVGVLKDYHQQSLKEKFEPQIYRLMPTGRDVRGQIVVKVNTASISETVDLVQSKFELFFPGNPFDYFFLDDYFDQQYKSDREFGTIAGLFSFIALIITSLGVFGLSLFNAVSRTKEIGIRKVLGAGAGKIWTLLAKEFFILIGLSFVISVPLLIWGLGEFLNNYAYRMAIDVWLFIMPLLLIVIITLLTVGFQIIKASLINPIESLHYE